MGNQNHVIREARLAKTPFIITAASLLPMLPFRILLLLYYNAMISIKVLQFGNSLVNVIIYPFRILEFKNGLLQMLCCRAHVRALDRRNELVPMHQGRLDQFDHFQELHIPNH